MMAEGRQESVMRSCKSFWFLLIMLSAFILLSTSFGCSKKQTAGGTVADVEQRDVAEVPERTEQAVDTVGATAPGYDLESEMPEDDERVKPEDLEEEFEPLASDTFEVQDVDAETIEETDYDLGYRVQVFASGDLEKAKGIKERVVAETGFPAYIEFENNLYKVRVGDFTSRSAAAQARAGLVELFQDCWIVQTTIRK